MCPASLHMNKCNTYVKAMVYTCVQGLSSIGMADMPLNAMQPFEESVDYLVTPYGILYYNY